MIHGVIAGEETEMLQLILDYNRKDILIPIEVLESIGATEDFGMLESSDGKRLAITRRSVIDSWCQRKRRGRPPRHRRNMDYWDVEEEAFRFHVPGIFQKAGKSDMPGEMDRCPIFGDKIGESVVVFDLPEPVDISTFEVVHRDKFRSMRKKAD